MMVVAAGLVETGAEVEAEVEAATAAGLATGSVRLAVTIASPAVLSATVAKPLNLKVVV